MKHTLNGFTLLEVIIATFLFSSLVVLISLFSVLYFRNSSFSFEEQQIVSQASTSVTLMLREIRKIQNGFDGSWPLIQTDDSTFMFFSDVTRDGRPDRVRYFLEGTDLKRGVIEPTNPPVDYVMNPEQITILASYVDATESALFTYYNGDWPGDTMNNPLDPASRILNTRFIRVHIKINPPDNFATQPFELSSGVSIRSMKTNL